MKTEVTLADVLRTGNEDRGKFGTDAIPREISTARTVRTKFFWTRSAWLAKAGQVNRYMRWSLTFTISGRLVRVHYRFVCSVKRTDRREIRMEM